MDWEIGKVKGFSGKNLINLENGGLKKVKVDSSSTYPSHLHPNKTEFIYFLFSFFPRFMFHSKIR